MAAPSSTRGASGGGYSAGRAWAPAPRSALLRTVATRAAAGGRVDTAARTFIFLLSIWTHQTNPIQPNATLRV
eukprot:scaffold3205_cov688-Prasinococcus_capsulatus_cf.AAC.1